MSPVLADSRLAVGGFDLAPLADADREDLFRHLQDAEVVEFMDISPLVARAEAQDIINWARELAERRGGLRWSIRRRGLPGLVGTCGFNQLELERGRRGEIAYDLARSEWGRGIMAEILPAVIAFGFRDLALDRLEALVTVGNHRSCTLLERHGFQREGVLRRHGYWKGRFWDQILYSRLRGEND